MTADILQTLRKVVAPEHDSVVASAQQARWLRVYWLDYAGILRFRLLEQKKWKPRCLKLTKKALWAGAEDDCCEGSPNEEEDIIEPDLKSLRPMPEADVACCLAVFEDRSSPWRDSLTCPRLVLQRALDHACDRYGISFLAGFELEFVLLQSVSPLRTIPGDGWCASSKLRPGSKALGVLVESYDALQSMGIDAPLIHAESAPGQLEIPLPPKPPLQSADDCVIAREVIHNASVKHGLKATFAPITTPGACGTALHFHISIIPEASEEVLVEEPIGMTRRERHFLAGIIRHLPALLAITLPGGASYGRVADNVHTGGTYACYGIEHRESLLRLCYEQEDGANTRRYHVEFKQSDNLANVYLSVAAVIHAGLLGIDEQLALPPPAHGVAAQMTESQRAKLGIMTRLPLTLPEALDCLRSDAELCKRIGLEAVDQHIRVREVRATIKIRLAYLRRLQNEFRKWQQKTDEEKQRMITTCY